MNKIPFVTHDFGSARDYCYLIIMVWNYYTGFSDPMALPGQKIVYTHAQYDQLGRSSRWSSRTMEFLISD